MKVEGLEPQSHPGPGQEGAPPFLQLWLCPRPVTEQKQSSRDHSGRTEGRMEGCERTMQEALVVKICRYLRAAAIRHTAVVRAFRVHSANKTF